MIGGLTVWILLSAFTVIEATEVPHQVSLTVVELGDDLIVTCPIITNEVGLFYWYKLNFGYMIQTIALGTYHKIALQGKFDNTRFNIKNVDNLQFLIIRNVSKEDEAMYFCQAGTAYVMEFINGTILAVKDHKNLQKQAYVKQSPETASVQLGDTVPLQCTLLLKNKDNGVQCPGEHSVYWFTAGLGGFHPGIIYTHSSRSDEEEERSCVYSLSKTIQSSSDTGLYYCAVVTCGKILFGGGTKVETRQELCPSDIALGILLPCCVVIAVVIVALILPRTRKLVCEHCREHNRSAEDQQSSMDGEAAALNYVALDFSSRKAKRSKSNRELSQESTYSAMRVSEVQF